MPIAMRTGAFVMKVGFVGLGQQAPWNQDFIEELCAFTGLPGGTDDQVDAASGAFRALAARRPLVVVGA